VNRHELADSPRGRSAGVRRGLDRADVAAHHHRHVAGTDVFLADERHVRGLHHRIGGLDRTDEAARLDQTKRFSCHM